MLTLSRAPREKSMTADGSPRTGPGCVCFHFANKIYNPLTPLTPHSHTSGPTGGWVGGWGSNWKSMYQFYSNKRENTRGQKSTNLPKLAKCLEWEQGWGEMADCSQRWAGPDGHCCIPTRGRERVRERETRWFCVCVCVTRWREQQNTVY